MASTSRFFIINPSNVVKSSLKIQRMKRADHCAPSS